MKGRRIIKRIIALVLALLMAIPANAGNVWAANKGELTDVGTGLVPDSLNTGDKISLPIKILDYEADGMLFEYANNRWIPETNVFGHSQQYQMTDGNWWFENYGDSLKPKFHVVGAPYVRLTKNANAGWYPGGEWNGSMPTLGLKAACGAGAKMDSFRYVTIVYRTNVTKGKIYMGMYRQVDINGDGEDDLNGGGASNEGNYTGAMEFTQSGADPTCDGFYWTYQVYDLKGTNLKHWDGTILSNVNVYLGLPLTTPYDESTDTGDVLDISRVAFFGDETVANEYGKYYITEGSDNGDNLAFGLLDGSSSELSGTAETKYSTIEEVVNTVAELTTYGQDAAGEDIKQIDMSTIGNLGYQLLGTFKDDSRGMAGLLESALREKDRLPVYKKEVVDYVAKLLEQTLPIPLRDTNGWKNYCYIQGEKREIYGDVDFATALRQRINGGRGSYEESAQKKLIGTWEEVKDQIETYYDAAYFMLNSIFVEGSYNEPQTDYDYLVLNQATETNTYSKVYIFDSTFADKSSANMAEAKTAVVYDETKKTISNQNVWSKAYIYYDDALNKTAAYPFLPITSKNSPEGQTHSPYFQDVGVISDSNAIEKYTNRNYNYVMASEGEFVYSWDQKLYFDFEGDDDVYLFINDELVLDLGGAHGINGYRIELNDYVEAAEARTLGDDRTDAGRNRNNNLALEEGRTYKFNFYYMERHGTGANMRINTNIKVTDPQMETRKTAYQNGLEIPNGGVVQEDDPIEYVFSIYNSGAEILTDLSFEDPAIGVTIDSENGLQAPGENVCDSKGEELDVTDISVVLSHEETGSRTISFATQAELMDFMKSLDSDKVVEKGGGLWQKSTITIRGIYYKLSEVQKEEGVFDNAVNTSAKTETASKVIYGNASMRVYTDDALVYYAWANHELNVTRDKLVQDFGSRIEGLTGEKVEFIKLTDSDGKELTTSEDIRIDASENLTLKYTTSGSKIFYVKLRYSCYDNSSTDEYEFEIGYGAKVKGKDAEGNNAYEVSNAHGYEFTNVSQNQYAEESTTVATSIENLRGCNALGASCIHLRPTGDGLEYVVVDIEDNPGTNNYDEFHWSTWEEGDIVLVVHARGTSKTDTNWKDRVMARGMKVGDFVKYDVGNLNADGTIPEGGTGGTIEVLGTEQVVRGVVNVTDVKDSVYVLDYGLSVDLLENDDLFLGDFLTIPGRNTVSQVLAIGGEELDYAPNNIIVKNSTTTIENWGSTQENKQYGKFIFDEEKHSLKYTPIKFMEGTDSIYAVVTVRESNYAEEHEATIGSVNINEEVQMYKSISVLPANVVYYEDDFPAIVYNEGNGQGNVFEQLGGGSENLTQSPDRDQEYGQDDVYKGNANTEMSGNAITQIEINKTGDIAYFDFFGTGFELMSRTNAFDDGLVVLKVEKYGYDENGAETLEAIKKIPVIPEFDQSGDGGKEEIYQVPLVRVKDLTYGKYRVTITGIAALQEGEKTFFYIDGLRIFQPIEESTYYNETEKGAIFVEIRDLILNGKAAIAGYSVVGDSDEIITVSTGTITWTENRNGLSHDESTFEGNRVDSVNDYLMLGPNNEVYMDGDYEGASALVFYVDEVDDAATHSLQIALHAIDKGQFYGTYSSGMEAFVVYGHKAEGKVSWQPLVTTVSGTEQYYSIDYTKCPYVPDRGYQVAIMVDSGMVSYTSLKYTGLNIGTMTSGEGELPIYKYENGRLVNATTGEEQNQKEAPAFLSLRSLLSTECLYLDEDTLGNNVIIEDIEGDNADGGVKEGILYQKRDNSDIRLIAYVDELTTYSKVSFTLTIDGKESKPLDCTKAYAGLYSNGVLKTTKDIYGEDGYFVTYMISDYIELFGGKEVTINVTYTTVTGETITDTRTVTIQ